MIGHEGMTDMLHTSLRVLDLVLECIAPRTTLSPQHAELAAPFALRVRLCARYPVFLVELPAQVDEVQLLVGDREPPGDVGELVPIRVQLVEVSYKLVNARRACSELVCEQVEDIEIPTAGRWVSF